MVEETCSFKTSATWCPLTKATKRKMVERSTCTHNDRCHGGHDEWAGSWNPVRTQLVCVLLELLCPFSKISVLPSESWRTVWIARKGKLLRPIIAKYFSWMLLTYIRYWKVNEMYLTFKLDIILRWTSEGFSKITQERMKQLVDCMARLQGMYSIFTDSLRAFV